MPQDVLTAGKFKKQNKLAFVKYNNSQKIYLHKRIIGKTQTMSPD